MSDPFDELRDAWAALTKALDACRRSQPNRARGSATWMAERLQAWRAAQPGETAVGWRHTHIPPPEVVHAGAARAKAALADARRRRPGEEDQ